MVGFTFRMENIPMRLIVFLPMHKWLLLFLLISTAAFGQFQPKNTQYLPENGLLSPTIYDIQQDPQGAIYITSDKGLQRFNGNEFETLSPLIIGQLTALSDNRFVGRTFQDSLAILEIPNQLHPIQATRPENQVSFSNFVKHEDDIYRIIDKKVYLFSRNGKIVNREIYSCNYQIQSGIIRLNQLYLLSTNQLIILDLTSYNWKSVPFQSTVGTTMLDIEGRVCFTVYLNRNEIYEYIDGQIVKIASEIFGSQTLKYTVHKQMRNGTILMGTYEGLFVYDKNFNLQHHYFEHEQISALKEDSDGGLWIGTLNNGLLFIPNFRHLELDAVTLAKSTHFSSHCKTKDGFVLGTFDGRICIFNQDGTLRSQQKLNTSAEVISLHYDSNRDVVYFFAGKLYSCDLKAGKTTEIPYLGRSIKAIASSGSELYIASNYQVMRDGKTLITSRYWNHGLEVDGNSIYLLNSQGLSVFDKDGNPNHVFLRNSSRTILQSLQMISRTDDDLYVASKDCIYALENNTLKKLVCIESGTIREFYTDAANIYVLIDNFVRIYNRETGKWLHKPHYIGETDVIGLIPSSNHVFVVRRDAVEKINPDVSQQIPNPAIYIREISGSYQLLGDKLIATGSENTLRLNLEVIPNYSFNQLGKIRYKISGLEKEWHTLEPKQTEILENRIPIGSYQLIIQYSVDGVHWKSGKTIPLEIRPYFYQTTWFRSLIALLIVALLILMIRWRIRAIKKKVEKRIENERLQRRAITSELKALRSQMNPHFIFNSLSVIQTKILEKQEESAYYNLNTFSKLLRQSLEFTSREWITLADELDFLRNYIQLETERFNHEINVTIDIEFDGKLDKVLFPSLLSQPFVENCFRHGLLHKKGERNLNISLTGTPENYKLAIADNGVGMDATKKINTHRTKTHKSFAMASIKERISLLNDSKKHRFTLDIQSDSGGTIVTIHYIQLK